MKYIILTVAFLALMISGPAKAVSVDPFAEGYVPGFYASGLSFQGMEITSPVHVNRDGSFCAQSSGGKCRGRLDMAFDSPSMLIDMWVWFAGRSSVVLTTYADDGTELSRNRYFSTVEPTSLGFQDLRVRGVSLLFSGARAKLTDISFHPLSPPVVSAVPIPAALPLFGAGLLGIAFLGRWRKRRAASFA